MTSLYNALNMKAKNSIYKSVFMHNEKTFEGYIIVEIEPYDETFLNAIATSRKYDLTLEKIMKKVYKYFNEKDVWLKVYSHYGHHEYLLNEYYMKQVFKLI